LETQEQGKNPNIVPFPDGYTLQVRTTKNSIFRRWKHSENKRGDGYIMDWISRLKNDLNKFILTKMDNNPTNEEIETLIKAGDIIDKYRQ